MSNEFMREERYIVFKISDVERYLTDKDRANITMMKMEIDAGRDCANKPPFKGLIVEADWPEYEPTWKAIEARVNGVQQVPDGSAVQTAARIMNVDLIRQRDAAELMSLALKAKIAEMEKQEPVAWAATDETKTVVEALGMNQSRRFDSPLFLAAGAQPAPSAVAYLDLGAGGYMDIGTDLTDEELDAIPRGRHMLGIIGTYGVEGYVPAQPAPSVPECPYPCEWRNLLKHAIEDGAYLARHINEDEPVTENARAVTMRMTMRLRDVLMVVNNAAIRARGNQ